jgi:hypothetical protein
VGLGNSMFAPGQAYADVQVVHYTGLAPSWLQ